MKDPYRILGLNRNATEEEIQNAYRKLAFQYDMTDKSDPHVQEINDAYDELIRLTRGQQNATAQQTPEREGPSQSGNAQGNYDQSPPSSELEDIRRMVQSGRLTEAEELLSGIPPQRRTAEWYFLKGTIAYNLGYLDTAYDFFYSADQLEPGNPEYAAAFRRVTQETSGAMPGNPYGANQSAMCDCCTTALCLNCCCSMGRGC